MTTYRCGKDCDRCRRCSPLSRRRFLKQMGAGLALVGAGALASACGVPSTPVQDTQDSVTQTTGTPVPKGWQQPESHEGDLPAGEAEIEIATVGDFTFDAAQVETLRPDIFQPGHFSLFDVLAHIGERGDVALDYHFDEAHDTHVIDAIDGRESWWYEAYYSSGWPEPNAFRMDMYPYKNNMRIQVSPKPSERVEAIHRTFREEVERLERNGGEVVLPSLAIRSPAGEWVFEDVAVAPHDVRSDVLQPGVITALDALISLTERGELPSLRVTWYETIGRADPVDSYWVERVGDAVAAGGCGFVYEVGPREFAGFSGSHIHIPSDVRVLVSPEYALWFWICL